jgi:Family of unknown function (DUF5681)
MSGSEALEIKSRPLESTPNALETEGRETDSMQAETTSEDDSRTAPPSSGPKPRGRPFVPGQSGNPNGRPKGARNKATTAVEALLEGEAETLTRRLIDKANEGDSGLLRFCVDRICPPRRDRVVTVEIPEIASTQDAGKAAAAVLAACAAGEISIADARDLVGLIESYVRLLESSEIEARLRALEAAAGASS